MRADRDRDEKRHAVDGDSGNAATGHPAGHGGAGQIHLRDQPAAENIAKAVGFAGKCGDLQGQVALWDRIFLFELYHAEGPLTRDSSWVLRVVAVFKKNDSTPNTLRSSRFPSGA